MTRRPRPRPDLAVLTAHVRGLHDDPFVSSFNDIGTAGRVGWRSVWKVYHGHPVKAGTAWALMAVTLEEARAVTAARPGAEIDATLARQQVRSMEALGWPLVWQGEQLGYTKTIGMPADKPTIRVELAHRIAALAARVGDRPGPSETARRNARLAGWYPPIFYDEYGHLIPSAVRGTSRETRRLDALAAVLRGADAAELSAEVGLSDRGIARAARTVGLEVHTTDGRISATPRQDQLAELIRAAAADVDRPAAVVWADLVAAAEQLQQAAAVGEAVAA